MSHGSGPILIPRTMHRPATGRGEAIVLAMLLLLVASDAVYGQTPQWIWSHTNVAAGDESIWFRRTFRTPPYNWNARLTVVADDSADVFLNGKFVARCERWDQPVRAEVSMRLNQGENVL